MKHIALAAVMLLSGIWGIARSGGKEQISRSSAEHFAKILGGSDARYQSKSKLKPADVEDAASAVWASWCAAVQDAQGGLLPDPGSLAQADSMAWQLPASLEPDAVMPFYWGYKTDSVCTPPAGPLPMFLYLHGSGPKAMEWSTGLKLAQRFDDAPSVYFVPQIPNEGKYYRWWQRSKQFAWDRLLRLALASGTIDPDRVYVLGISEGGYGSQRLASYYADYLAGAGPMAGGEPLRNAPVENLRNIAFSLRTGAEDDGFFREKLTRYTLRALDSVAAVHPEYKYNVELIPGCGHHIDYFPTSPWLRQHVRDPYPRHVSWENYEMDSVCRTGFYNLVISRPPSVADSVRIMYRMDIDDHNNIDLTAEAVHYTVTELDPIWGDIQMDFTRSYEPVDDGELIIYLNDKLVDLSRPVTVRVNGRKCFHGKVQLRVENLINSCAEFGDPRRLYPGAVRVKL